MNVSRLTITIPTDLGYITVAKVKEDVKELAEPMPSVILNRTENITNNRLEGIMATKLEKINN